MPMSRHHAEWLSLIEVSGPFLSMPVLLRVFPQGLDQHEPEPFKTLHAAFEEWQESQSGSRPDAAIHNAWIRYVLTETLELPDELVLEGQAISPSLQARIAEHGETLRPDLVLVNPDGSPSRRHDTAAAHLRRSRSVPHRHCEPPTAAIAQSSCTVCPSILCRLFRLRPLFRL